MAERYKTATGTDRVARDLIMKAAARDSKDTQRMQAAGVRACTAYRSIAHSAKRLEEELEEVTSTDGIPQRELSAEDSVVVALEGARAAVAKTSGG